MMQHAFSAKTSFIVRNQRKEGLSEKVLMEGMMKHGQGIAIKMMLRRMNVYVISLNSMRTTAKVLPEKLTSPQLIRKFPAFYGTRRFIVAFTRARHLSLS
jgi:hypothetical protein